MKCDTCNNEANEDQMYLGRCCRCTAQQLQTIERRYNLLQSQVKDLADTIDAGIGVNSDKSPISRLSSQLTALLQVYINERVKNMKVPTESQKL